MNQMTIKMPERRPGQDNITIYVPTELKESFKKICALKGTSMTEEITSFVKDSVEKHKNLLQVLNRELNR